MISDNIERLRSQLPEGVELVAVSKLKPVADIEEAYACGQRDFGENYAAELRDKHAQLPADIRWHFVGHLQAKQLKYYANYVALIHGIDSLQHLADVESAAAKVGRVVDVLLQAHVAQEATKFGFAPNELQAILPEQVTALEHVRIRGLMGMASHTDDRKRVRADFRVLRGLYEGLKNNLFAQQSSFDILSMGMSQDWQIAVDEGSTMVRIGTDIFGARPPRANDNGNIIKYR